MGGAMAAVTDASGIQFRILNGSKGPAVRATRAQIDRQLYRAAMRERIEATPNLDVFGQAVDDLIVEHGRAAGVVTQTGIRFHARAVVITAGTFLNGLSFTSGSNTIPRAAWATRRACAWPSA